MPAQIIITMTKTQLDECAGIAQTASGVEVPVAEALELAAGADKYLAVFKDHSAEPLYLGYAKRTAQKGQRLVMFARDRGCSHPGCSNPAMRVEAHHNDPWANGGRTDIDDLAAACPPHHKLIGDGPDSWQTIIINSGPDKGRVGWIPPVSADPKRIPRVNRTHHANETVEAAWRKVHAARLAALAKNREKVRPADTPPRPNDGSGRNDS